MFLHFVVDNQQLCILYFSFSNTDCDMISFQKDCDILQIELPKRLNLHIATQSIQQQIQMKVSSQPYLKTYIFPVLSLGTLLRLLFLVLAVALPFFLTYSTPNFFLPSHLQVATNQPIKYSYTYHVTITTSKGIYTYTNLYQVPSNRPPIISQSDSSSCLMFKVKWPSSPDQAVLSTQISLFFSFDLEGTSHYGSAFAQARGYSLAEASISGSLSIVKGTGSSPVTSNSLPLLGYDPVAFFNAATLSQAFLNYDNSVSAINMPSDVFEVSVSLNYAGFLATQQTPSILGQLIWSWVQYFPIFLSLYWVLDAVFSFLSKEQILKRKIVHDVDYLEIVAEETERREGLRMS